MYMQSPHTTWKSTSFKTIMDLKLRLSNFIFCGSFSIDKAVPLAKRHIGEETVSAVYLICMYNMSRN